MTDFNIHTEESAPQASKDLLKTLKGNYGFLANLYAVQSESPAMLEAYVALNKISETPLDAAFRPNAWSPVNSVAA